MLKTAMKNLHVPLPETLYLELRAEADRERRPATEVARQAIDDWLAERKRKQIYDALQEYARKMAGTGVDLDPELEASGIECLLSIDQPKGKAK